jgi:hypothetical protein
MRQFLNATAGASAILAAALLAGAAGAQTMDNVGPHNPYCGSWSNGTWASNGNCVDETTTTTTVTTQREAAAMPGDQRAAVPMTAGRTPQRVTGTITAVRGHLVTLQQSNNDLVINDQPALDQEATGRVAVGRVVTAHGYWQDGTFYADRFDTGV